MYMRQAISVGNLLLDTGNYRIITQTSQKGARDAIIAEQGKKLTRLAEDILDNGLNPFDLPMVIDAADGNHNFVVIEGNRRLTAIQLLMQPELAKDTPLHASFAKMHKSRSDAIPKVLDCVIAANKPDALTWINRKHKSGMEGAGTEPWLPMAKARAEVDQGVDRADLDVINFVLATPDLEKGVRHDLEGSKFNLTNLERLLTTKELQEELGLSLKDGKIRSTLNEKWIRGVLIDIVTTISKGKRAGLLNGKFTERNIDSAEHRKDFVRAVLEDHPGKQKAKLWTVQAHPKLVVIPKAVTKPAVRSTASTEEQISLVPKSFKLELPAGKINDIFTELKRLDATRDRHAVSVLFRVFLELSLHAFADKHKIQMPLDQKGRPNEKLKMRLQKVVEKVKADRLMTATEIKSIDVAMGDPNSFLAPETLNAYVHSPWMNPEPMGLKVGWLNVQLFIQRIWEGKK